MTSRQAVVLAAALCLAGYAWVYGSGLAYPVVRSDGFSYYVYVPSWFLYRDTTLASVARDCCGGFYEENTGITRWPGTRRWVNVHPIGVAVMQAPVFPVAHALTKWSNLTADGFTIYYQHAAGLAGLAWVVAGLAVLRRLLRKYFADRVVAIALLTLLLGSNLFHYATFDSSYSHAYSFFLFAAFMYLSDRWHERPSRATALQLGCVAGLIVLVRHPNGLFLLTFVLYGLGSRESRRATWARLRAHWRDVAWMALVTALVIAPQLAIYYQATGQLLVSSYGELGFDWTKPRLFDVLFGVTKGLFFWSPLLLLGVAGLVSLSRSANAARAFVVPAAVFLLVHTYLIASWWDWQLGGSYGSRGFVDTLPPFALGLAAFFDRAWRSRWRRLTAITVCVAGVGLTLFQMLQYWYGMVPFNDTTWELYRQIFLRWR